MAELSIIFVCPWIEDQIKTLVLWDFFFFFHHKQSGSLSPEVHHDNLRLNETFAQASYQLPNPTFEL